MVNDVTALSPQGILVESVMDIESLPERVKRIMKDQPLNPFVKMEVRLLPRQRAVRRQPESSSSDNLQPLGADLNPSPAVASGQG